MNQKLWEPTLIGETAIEKLQIEKGFDSYSALHDWSVKNPGEFWSKAWDDCEIVGGKGNQFFQPGEDFISAKFFTDAKLNVAQNLLAKGGENEIAIVSILEDGTRSEITWGQLRIKVAATAAAMRAEGVVKGESISNATLCTHLS